MRTRRTLLPLFGLTLITASALSQPPPGTPVAKIGALTPKPASLTVAFTPGLWPKVGGIATVFYVIDESLDPDGTATPKIEQAIQSSNADFPTTLQWVKWNSSDGPNYVDIELSVWDTSGVCEANEGYEARPAQPMTGSTDCTVGTILHEMGHVIGLLHEQSRPDRGKYITVKYANVIKGSWSNFLSDTDDEQILEPYDYASVMQYIPFAFTRNGGPVIESIPAGIPLAGYEGVPAEAGGTGVPSMPAFDYSAGDKEAIARLYGVVPTHVIVTSNPIGLSVIVDGITVTTPHTYAWALWSTHTLDVADAVQMQSGYVLGSTTSQSATFYYTYGRWNDSTDQSHTITVVPGNGSPLFPATAPQLSTYSANFVQLVPYTAAVSLAASGQVSVAPQPQAYSGVSGEFFVAREEVTLTATPAGGWNFYEIDNSPLSLPGGLGANPRSFYVPDSGNPINATVKFSASPIYSINVLPQSFSSNLYAFVDGARVYTPKNYSVAYDTAWTPGSQHTLSVDDPEYPYSVNSRYNFSHWSDGGAQTDTINSLPAASTTYNAMETSEYQPANNFNYSPCGGSAETSPASPTDDGFYPSGTKLSLSATPDTGWTFGGWTYDLSGTPNPASLGISGETLVYANFNIVPAPLSLTSIAPATVAAGSAGFTLTLTGTGFAQGSVVSIDGQYPTFKYVNAQTLTVPVTAEDVAKPGAFQVFVENYPVGWTGCAVFGYATFIVSGAGTITATPVITPAAGGYSTAQTVKITDVTPDATLYYTVDGSAPTTSSPVYGGAFTVSTTTTVKARAIESPYRLSVVAAAAYTIEPATATPVLSPAPGSYAGATQVKITDATAGSAIYYTTDGTTPTTSSTQYSGPITVSSTSVLKADASSSGHLRSAVAGGTYTIN